MGKGRKNSSWKPTTDDQPPFTERHREIFRWAKDNLPDEYPRMVVSAYLTLNAGSTPTPGTVMARLEAQGRTAAQMKAKGWL